MSFDWTEYLYLAREITGSSLKPASEEAKNRAAISRAYYAAFGKARSYLYEMTPYVPSTRKDTHWDVIDQFLYSTDNNRRLIGKGLKQLLQSRQQADYEGNFPQLASETSRCLDIAGITINRINGLR